MIQSPWGKEAQGVGCAYQVEPGDLAQGKTRLEVQRQSKLG